MSPRLPPCRLFGLQEASHPTPVGRSDYGPFLQFGIPAGGLDSGAEGIKTDKDPLRKLGMAGRGTGTRLEHKPSGLGYLASRA